MRNVQHAYVHKFFNAYLRLGRCLLSALISPFSTKFAGILVQANDLHFVVVLLDEAAQGKAKTFVWAHTPVHGVQWPWRQVFVYFLAFAGGR